MTSTMETDPVEETNRKDEEKDNTEPITRPDPEANNETGIAGTTEESGLADKAEEKEGLHESGEEISSKAEKGNDEEDESLNKSTKDDVQEDNDQDDDDDDDDDDEEEEEEGEDDNASLNTAEDSRVGETENGGRRKKASKSSFGSHIPHHLHEGTLHGIRNYLKEFEANQPEPLDEDEITMMITRADRNVENRARYAEDPLDEVVDGEQLRKELYQEEEEYLIGHDFIKDMHTTLQRKKKKRGYPDKRTLNWVKRAAGLNRKDYHTLHSALGLEDIDDDSDENNIDGTKKIVPKRYTRGMAKSTRIKKKEEFIFKDTMGLKSLLHSIEELEPEFGPYPKPFECSKSRERHRHSDRKKRSAPSRVASDDEDESAIGRRPAKAKYNSQRPSGPMPYPLVARLPEDEFNEGLARDDFLFGDNRDLLVVKIIVNGEHVDEDGADARTTKERKRELKRLRDRQYQKRKRDAKLKEKERRKTGGEKYTTPLRSNSTSTKRRRDYGSDEEEQRRPKQKTRSSRQSDVSGSSRGLQSVRTGKDSISLALLDWQRRQMWTPNSARRLGSESEREIRKKIVIPPHLKKSGIGYRLPPWESVNPACNVTEQSDLVEPARGRHSDEVYASWTHKLINCLNGSCRAWAIHEFFYSDIDRAWYNANPFARDVAKLGILPTAKLTRREWGAVRRMIPNRPRRFSKRFIFSQLRDRNNYRNMVRQLQRNPTLTNQTGYAIPAPIKVGTTVTAYNKKFLILHRGVVLLHDSYSARYLVQFERKELGFEFVSDTQVASHGIPEILMPPAPSILTGDPVETAISKTKSVGELPYGTSFGPLSAARTKDRVTCETEFATLLSNKSDNVAKQTPSKDEGDTEEARAALVEKVAERETLVSLMSIIDATTARKTMILDLMEKFNVLLVDRLPFGEGPPSNHVMSGYFEKHYAWLRANLEVTNRSLDIALAYLQVMYGKAYSSTPANAKVNSENIKKLFVETFLVGQDRSLCGGSPTVTMPWVDAIHRGSEDVGNYLSTLICKEREHALQNGGPQENGSGHPAVRPLNGHRTGTEAPNSDFSYQQSRVAAAGSLLSSISYCCGRASESDVTAPDDSRPLLDAVLTSSLEKLKVPGQPSEDHSKVHQSMLSLKGLAEKELKDSLELLSKEFTAISAIKGANKDESSLH